VASSFAALLASFNQNYFDAMFLFILFLPIGIQLGTIVDRQLHLKVISYYLCILLELKLIY
jgi:hypothetical protein